MHIYLMSGWLVGLVGRKHRYRSTAYKLYCWSSALIPKPGDWPEHISISGFFFRDAPIYDPPKRLQAFLDDGPPPVYIGFGSIVLEDPTSISKAVVDAVHTCGQRAIIARGWSKLDGPAHPKLYWLDDDCPHEWLFKHVSMVVHHGGAGTTAVGLKEARPTIIVPFFGDQPFWSSMVAAAGAGPEGIPQKQLTADKLAEAIDFCTRQETQEAARTMASQIHKDDGVYEAVRSFHANSPIDRLKCDMFRDQPAVWTLKLGGKRVQISNVAAGILVKDTGLDAKNLAM